MQRTPYFVLVALYYWLTAMRGGHDGYPHSRRSWIREGLSGVELKQCMDGGQQRMYMGGVGECVLVRPRILSSGSCCKNDEAKS